MVLWRAVVWLCPRPSRCRPVPCACLRTAWRNVTTIGPATPCHQSHDGEPYRKYTERECSGVTKCARCMDQTVSLVDVGGDVGAYAARQPPSLHGMGSQTARRGAAPQPVCMRDNLPYMARAGFEFLTAAHVRDIRFPL